VGVREEGGREGGREGLARGLARARALMGERALSNPDSLCMRACGCG
jgi:hypothetical protein